MAKTLAKHQAASPLAELFDWLESGVPSAFRAMAHPVRIEDFEEEGRFVIRAELPGVGPDRDVEITVAGGLLTVRGERREEERDKNRSEFRYGAFERRITLPAGIDEREVTAEYRDGILEVSFPKGTPKLEPRRISVQRPTA